MQKKAARKRQLFFAYYSFKITIVRQKIYFLFALKPRGLLLLCYSKKK